MSLTRQSALAGMTLRDGARPFSTSSLDVDMNATPVANLQTGASLASEEDCLLTAG
jgi:hypothetical protein